MPLLAKPNKSKPQFKTPITCNFHLIYIDCCVFRLEAVKSQNPETSTLPATFVTGVSRGGKLNSFFYLECLHRWLLFLFQEANLVVVPATWLRVVETLSSFSSLMHPADHGSVVSVS